MTIRFTPLGIPFSSSFAVSASIALNVPAGGFPISASYAEYALSPAGPQGAAGKEIFGSVTPP